MRWSDGKLKELESRGGTEDGFGGAAERRDLVVVWGEECEVRKSSVS